MQFVDVIMDVEDGEEVTRMVAKELNEKERAEAKKENRAPKRIVSI